MNQIIAEIPYAGYWSTPFFKWQGNVQNLHPLKFAAWVAKRELAKRNISPDTFDHGILGTSVPQAKSFYGLPWLASEFGAHNLAGPTIAQACATGVRCIATADQEIKSGLSSSVLVITADRTSNGPHIYYPNPQGPGGTGAHEDWVMDNFNVDPLGGHPMVQTAENIAIKHGISTAEQHEVVLQRVQQYQQATANDYAFQKRYMTLPFDIPNPSFRKVIGTAQSDEGVTISTAEGLLNLKPVLEGGTVTYGGQTYPADGNSALIMTTEEKAIELSTNSNIAIRVLSYGQGRCDNGYMPEAVIPSTQAALKNAGLDISQIDAFKSHNPFAANDLVFAKLMGVDLTKMNNYGCSLIWGHPQGPTGVRSVIELIEELVIKGGGIGLFFGCAAGDSAMSLIIEVADRK